MDNITDNTSILVNNVSKSYIAGKIGSRTLARDFERWRYKILGKEDPNRKLDEPVTSVNASQGSEQFWSLRNISCEIKQGESFGIIGRNGAGKSTLLKVLSRITSPTSGQIIGRGKVASLLEIGTGFHPELSGRENIFLNGAILGQRRADISRKLDDIVNFAGIERHIDTPVKRYSSGMYVRLAFAVAAHLEPDILIIDEVLAVGDAEFQKKCLGKLSSLNSSVHRTVIFVSHNMQAVRNLCTKCMWLDQGQIVEIGNSNTVINHYIQSLSKTIMRREFPTPAESPGTGRIRVMSIELRPHFVEGLEIIDIRTPIDIFFNIWIAEPGISITASVLLFSASGECIFDLNSKEYTCENHFVKGSCQIPGNFLNDGSYFITLHFSQNTSISLFTYNECLSFDVADYRENTNWYEKWWGVVRPNFPVTLHT